MTSKLATYPERLGTCPGTNPFRRHAIPLVTRELEVDKCAGQDRGGNLSIAFSGKILKPAESTGHNGCQWMTEVDWVSLPLRQRLEG